MSGVGLGLWPIWSGRFSRGRVLSDLFRFVRLCSGCSGPVPGSSLSGRGDFCVVGSCQVCSGLFGSVRGVRGRCRGLRPIWSGRFSRGRVSSDLFRFVRLCSRCSGPAKGCCLSGRGDFRVVGSGQICSGLVSSVRGVRGGRRRALVGPLSGCGGATVSRCGVRWEREARRRRRLGADSRSGAGMTRRGAGDGGGNDGGASRGRGGARFSRRLR